MSLWGPDRDRDADDAAQADRAEQVGFRPFSTPGGGGGSRSRASLQFPFWFFGAAFAAAEVIDRVFT